MNWSEGEEKIITVSSFAGNSHVHKSPGIYKKWKIKNLFLTIVADATVANRYFSITHTNADNSVVYRYLGYSNAVTASQTKNIMISSMCYAVTVNTGGGADMTYGYSNDIIISTTEAVTISITGGVAGDAVTGYMLVTELPA